MKIFGFNLREPTSIKNPDSFKSSNHELNNYQKMDKLFQLELASKIGHDELSCKEWKENFFTYLSSEELARKGIQSCIDEVTKKQN